MSTVLSASCRVAACLLVLGMLLLPCAQARVDVTATLRMDVDCIDHAAEASMAGVRLASVAAPAPSVPSDKDVESSPCKRPLARRWLVPAPWQASGGMVAIVLQRWKIIAAAVPVAARTPQVWPATERLVLPPAAPYLRRSRGRAPPLDCVQHA